MNNWGFLSIDRGQRKSAFAVVGLSPDSSDLFLVEEVLILPCDRESIINAMIEVKARLQFEDVYADEEMRKWFKQDGLWLSIIDRIWNDQPERRENLFDLRIHRRDSDPILRQMDALHNVMEKGEISLAEHLINNASIMREFSRIGSSVIMDAIAGGVSVAKHYQNYVIS